MSTLARVVGVLVPDTVHVEELLALLVLQLLCLLLALKRDMQVQALSVTPHLLDLLADHLLEVQTASLLRARTPSPASVRLLPLFCSGIHSQ